MGLNDRDDHKEGESNLANAASTGSLADTSREFRITVRKNRIEANRTAKQKPNEDVGMMDIILMNLVDGAVRRAKKIEPETKEAGKSKIQINDSRRRLETSKLNSNELVTNVRVGFVAREGSRRMDETKKSDTWKTKRKDVDQKTAVMQADIGKQWDKVLYKNQPYHLHQVCISQKDQTHVQYLLEQKRAIDDLMAIKGKLIQDYTNEIKSKDDEYVKELKRQAEEIDILVERMNRQYKAFQISFVEELEQIERAFVDERNDLITNNYKEIEGLFEARRKNEA